MNTSINLTRVMLGALLALAMGASLTLLWLVVPRTPATASSLSFDGFILLPRSRLLNVMDYVSVSGSSLFLTSESEGSVYEANIGEPSPSRTAVAVAPGEGQAHGVVIDHESGLAFVTRSGSNVVDVFRPGSMTFVRHIPVADDPDGIFDLTGQGLLYVVSGDSMTATLIDPAREATVGLIALGGKPEFAVYDPGSQRIYQNLADKNMVAVVDLQSRQVTERWPLQGCDAPSGMAADFAARKLFIVCSRNARLIVVDLGTRQVVATLPVGSGPDAVVFDAKLRRLYVAGRSGVLDVVQQDGPDTYRSVDAIPTHYGAHTLALDPRTHKVYVAYASLLARPRVAVFSPVSQ